MKRAAVLLLLISMLLTGCGAKNAEDPQETEKVQYAAKDEENTMSQKMALMIDGAMIPVIWEENPSVAELTEQAAQKAMQIEMSMYGGWEQVGSLGHSISKNDVQLTADNGDIMLYSGNQIVLFYGENTWAYTKLGHIDLPENEITALLSGGAVSITLAVQ